MANFGSRLTGFFGSTGGGGGGLSSVYTDNFTILGNGLIATPLYATNQTFADANVDLSGGDYDILQAGVYRVITFGNSLIFNYSPLNGQRLTIINSQQYGIGNILLNGGAFTVLYQGTNTAVTSIPSGTTYEFVYSATNTTWYCYNPQNSTTARINLDSLGSNYTINQAGLYLFTNNFTGYSIDFADATYYNGLQVTAINSYTNALPITNAFYPYPINPNGTNITTIGAGVSRTFCAINYNGTSYWVAIK
jgi:hypothetical protein